MSKHTSSKLCKEADNLEWKQALRDAEEKLKEAKGEVSEWEAAVRTLRERIAEGSPWPGKVTA